MTRNKYLPGQLFFPGSQTGAVLMETPKVRRIISESDVRTKWLQFSVASGSGKLKVIPIAELMDKQNSGQRCMIKLMLLHSSATIFHVYSQEFCGYDLFFCVQTHTCP